MLYHLSCKGTYDEVNNSWDTAQPELLIGKREVWQPRVPETYDHREDHRQPRICLAPTIEQCLHGISQWSAENIVHVREFSAAALAHGHRASDRFTVWVPVGNPPLVCPSHREVPDINISDEHWITVPWTMQCFGIIEHAWACRTKDDPLEWRWASNLPNPLARRAQAR